MSNEPALIIPEIDLNPDGVSWEEMERRLYQNFLVIRETLSVGITTTQVIGTNKAYFVNGVLTRYSTAT